MLLYAFVWTVVRSASRQLRTTPAAAARRPEPPPTRARRLRARPSRAAGRRSPASARAAARGAARRTTSLRAAAACTERAGETDDERARPRANLDPRLVVEELARPGGGPGHRRSRAASRSAAPTAADLSIGDQFVSHMHARILRRGAYHFVEDLGSTNGTFLNDLRVEHDAQLKVHDSLRIGQTTLRYEE